MVTESKPAKTTTCGACKVACKRFGVNRNGTLRFRCPQCRKTYSESRKSLVGRMTVPTEKVLAILNLFIEGTSVRSTERLTGVHRDTILKVLVAAGEKCEKLMGRLIVNVPVKDVECDEIWGFIQKKEGHKSPEEGMTIPSAMLIVSSPSSAIRNWF